MQDHEGTYKRNAGHMKVMAGERHEKCMRI